MPKRKKHWHEMTTEERIREAGWFKGTEKQWQALSMPEREEIAFKGCGCLVAYPTWTGPVECVHPKCQIRRGEKQPITLTNGILKYEMESGWLRFAKETTEGRQRLGKICRAVRKHAMKTGVYNPWDMPGGWQIIVGAAVDA